jgi:uncharacterized protein YjdB
MAPPDLQVRVGQTQTFYPDGFDRNGQLCVDVRFTWTTNNAAVAVVDAQGNVRGVAPGTAIITATSGTAAARRSGQAVVQVIAEGPAVVSQRERGETPPPPTTPASNRPSGQGCAAWDRQPEGSGVPVTINITPSGTLQLVRGEQRQLSYQTVDENSRTASRVCIVFDIETPNSRVASVDTVGQITAGSDTGRVRVRATIQDPRAQVRTRYVTVVVSADSVRFRDSTLSVSPGTSDTLRIVVPSQENRVLNPRGIFFFESANPAVARVGLATGVVEALAPGTARITATSDAGLPSMSVLVNVHARVRYLEATPAESMLTIAMQSTRTLAARAMAEDSTHVPQAPLRWQAPDPNIVQWDSTTRTVRGLRIGETRVAVTAPAGRDQPPHSKVWRIRVVAGGLRVSRARVGLGVNERTPVRVMLLDDGQQPIEEATNLTWTSSDSTIARVEGGQVVGLRVGRARLTARAAWDSTVSLEAFVVGDMVVTVQRQGRWDIYHVGGTTIGAAVTQDTLLEADNVAWSPDLTRLAWVAAPNSRAAVYELWTANADGSEARRLTTDSAEAHYPMFVPPNGEQIVFQSSRSTRPQIYAIGRDGQSLRALASGDYQNYAPNVSPDGRKLVFISLRQTAPGTQFYDVYEIGMDGQGERRLTTGRPRESLPSYSADGSLVYFLRDSSGTQRLIELNPATNAERPLTPVGMFVWAYSFSADRSTAVLTVEERNARRVKLLNLASGQLTDFPAAAGDVLGTATFRPATPRPR